jgi:hypothetical protein
MIQVRDEAGERVGTARLTLGIDAQRAATFKLRHYPAQFECGGGRPLSGAVQRPTEAVNEHLTVRRDRKRGPQLLTVARAECRVRTPRSEAGPSHDPGRDGDDQEAHDQAGPKDGVFVALAHRASRLCATPPCASTNPLLAMRLCCGTISQPA